MVPISIGINGLSPSSDAIVSSTIDSISSPIGRSPIPLTPPHILGLFSPSEHSDAFLNSLNVLSPKGNSRQGSPDFDFSDDEFSQFQLPSQAISEYDDFLNGMGGMDDMGGEISPRYSSNQQSWSNSLSFMSPPTYHSILKSPTISSSVDMNVASSPTILPPISESPTQNSTQFGEHPSGEHPSRTLFVRNINSNIEELELKELFEAFGPTRSIYTQCKHRGFVMVSFYDIRHAKNAIRSLQGKVVRRRKLDIHYSIPRNNPSEKDQNQGTLVVFNLDPSTTHDELLAIFGNYGEIKEIRETPNKKHHKFIEFYDVREAEEAMRCLNKTDIKGKKIKIEPSRPGGRKVTQSSPLSPRMQTSEDPLLKQYPVVSSSDSYSNGYSRFTSFSPPTPTFSKSDRNSSLSSSPQTTQRRSRSRSSLTFSPDFENRRSDQYSLNIDLLLSHQERRSTLMIRNIPNKYTQKMLLSEIEEVVPGTYDFFYLPIDFKNKCNVGYAFINFVHPLSVVKFYQEFHHRTWEKFNSEKVCEITFARIQGKDALVHNFQKSSLLNEDKKCRPIVFHTEGPNIGQQAPFPIVDNGSNHLSLGEPDLAYRSFHRMRSGSYNERLH